MPSHHKNLSILITTNHLYGWTGSETLILTLVNSLVRSGCNVAIYARQLDKQWLAAHIPSGTVATDDLTSIRHMTFDLAHIQHNACLVEVRTVFPTLPIIFSSLGVLPFLEQPLSFDLDVNHYFAISEEVVENLLTHGVPREHISIIRNLVNDRQFFPVTPIRQNPERILVISYKMGEAMKASLRAAATTIGASIRFIGGLEGKLQPDELAVAINSADVVVSLGRGAIEAMLCGRVPLVFDIHGGDGLVTPSNIEAIQRSNFSGRRYRISYTADSLVEELKKYRPEYGSQLRAIAVEAFGTDRNTVRLLDVYQTVSTTCPAPIPAPTSKVLDFHFALATEDFRHYRNISAENERLRSEIRRVKTSVSWRVTAPLRVIWNMIQRLRKKTI